MSVSERALGVFNPGWVVSGIGVGLALQLLAWLAGIGLLGGLSGYLVMGIVVGWASPGDTVIEPGVAAFVIAALGFAVDHWVLTLLAVGLLPAAGYGLLGLAVGMAGGWIGERLQAAL